MTLDLEESDDEKNRKSAKKNSWLNALFSENQMDVNEKKIILSELLKDHKKEENNEII